MTFERIVRKQTEGDGDIWAVVLTGWGSQAFCAGVDLQEVSAGRGKDLWTEGGGFAGVVFADRSKPWIAAVNGPALAAGINVNAPIAVRESLVVVCRANDLPNAELLAMTEQSSLRVQASDDSKQGPPALIEKRAPKWTGR